MRNTTKRVLSFIMVIALMLTLAPLSVFAAGTGTTVYLKPNSNWLRDGARFAVYLFGNGEKWVSMSDSDGDGYYEATIPSGYPSIIFCRMSPNASANNWNNKWNQTADLTLDATKNCYTVKEGTWDKGGGTWSVYTPW